MSETFARLFLLERLLFSRQLSLAKSFSKNRIFCLRNSDYPYFILFLFGSFFYSRLSFNFSF